MSAVNDLLPAAVGKSPSQAPTGSETGDGSAHEVVLIHFLDDGFTAMGQLFYRGQELRMAKGDEHWKMTLDRNGRSWVEMSEEDQAIKYGKIFFRPGEWPFKNWSADEARREMVNMRDTKTGERTYSDSQVDTAIKKMKEDRLVKPNTRAGWIMGEASELAKE